MLFVSITRPELLQRIPDHVDGVEVRLDLFPTWTLTSVRELLVRATCPVMMTLRRRSHGGEFAGSEEEREAEILKLLELKPQFIDLEYDMREGFLEKVLQTYPETKCILSYHNFQKTPDDLEGILRTMTLYPAYHYKIAALALSTNDALRILLFARVHPQVSAICMGERGEFARILGPVVGNLINYASIAGEQTAPGQLSVGDLLSIYRFPLLNRETALYGLIGDPVAQSQGHLYHNTEQSLNAIYVKMCVKSEELTDFFPMAKEMGFRGLSVTMPLKGAVIPFLDEIEAKTRRIGAANTLLFNQGRIFGTNTDGIGALDAIEKRGLVRNKSVVLIGAGGVARAIAYEAQLRGARVWIVNRTMQRAQELGALMGYQVGGLADLPPDYDILINCSPDPMPIDRSQMHPRALVMDSVYVPRETLLLKEAARMGCQVIYGEEMFWNQAAAQRMLWKK